jgi:hypothetical protein
MEVMRSLPYLLPVEAQLTEPVEGTDVAAAHLGQLVQDVAGVHLHRDQRHDLQPQDLGQVAPDGVRVAVEQGHLEEEEEGIEEEEGVGMFDWRSDAVHIHFPTGRLIKHIL